MRVTPAVRADDLALPDATSPPTTPSGGRPAYADLNRYA